MFLKNPTETELRIETLEDRYDALALVPDHRWGAPESEELQAIVSELRELYEVAATDEFDRIVL